MHRHFLYKNLIARIFLFKKQPGFSLIDVLLVVAIFSIVLSTALSVVPRRTIDEDLYAKSKQIVEFISEARNYSMSGYFGDVWGIKVLDADAACQDSGDCLVMFKGKTYLSRDSSYDRVLELNTSVFLESDQENEFYFSYKSGWLTSATSGSLPEQSILVSSTLGDSKTIRIMPSGSAYVFTCGDSSVYDLEGNAYTTVQIGDQCWMAENLNTGTMLDYAATDPTDNGIVEKWCYASSTSNCDTYGGLYLWNEAMNWETTEGVQGICPAGWHLPISDEIDTLFSHYYYVGAALKQGGESTFELLLGGNCTADTDTFSMLGILGMVWGSTEANSTQANAIMVLSYTGVGYSSIQNKTIGASIRCIQD